MTDFILIWIKYFNSIIISNKCE